MKRLYLSFFLFTAIYSLKAQTTIYTEEELGFDPGELIIIEGPDNETIEPLVLQSFRGKPRLGSPRTYKNISGKWDDSKTRQTKKFLTNTFNSSIKTLQNLMSIDATRNTIDIAKISSVYRPISYYTNNTTYLDNIKEINWINQFQKIAGQTLTPDAYKKYLNPEGKVRSYRPITKFDRGNTYQRGQAKWGTGSSDFAKLRIAKEFINNEISKYLEWSKNLPKEVYGVGQVNIGDYNFDLEGFMVNLKTAGIGTIDKEEEHIFFNKTLSDKVKTRGYFTLIKMSPEKAEAFIEKIEGERGRRRLYYVYLSKLEMQISRKNIQNSYKFNIADKLVQTPISKKIEFFKDENLIEKVLELSARN